LQIDPFTGEKHIADVKNEFGLVIEFQRSTMTEDERISRETFYQDMVWVVDGSRGDSDSAYFNMGTYGPIQISPLLYKVEWWGRSSLFHFWSGSSKNVYLDFGDNVLWQLISFNSETRVGLVGLIPKSVFVEDCLSGKSVRTFSIDDDYDTQQYSMPRPLIERKIPGHSN
jgi:competence protein CoiA